MNNKVQKYIIGTIGLVLLVLFFYNFINIIAWILIAASIAMLGNPIITFIRKFKIGRIQIPRSVAALLTIALIYFIIIFCIRLVYPIIINQISSFQAIDIESISDSLEKPIKSIDNFIQTTPIISQPDFSTEDFIISKITTTASFSNLGKLFNDIGSTIANLLMSLFVITFITFFFLKDNTLFLRGILIFVPTRYEEKTGQMLRSIKTLITRYLFGVIVEIILMTILYTLGLYIIGINFNLALSIGLIAGILNIIPYIGPIIGGIVGTALFIFANLNLDFGSEIIPMILKIFLIIISCKALDDSVFQPFIYSKSIKAHPLEIFIVILIAGSLSGVLGMMLAIPVYTVIRVIAREFLFQYKFIRQITNSINPDAPEPPGVSVALETSGKQEEKEENNDKNESL